MSTELAARVSRRNFLASASAATTMAWLAPRKLFAQEEGLVQTARKTAATDKITIQKLRGNVNVLLGAGGNIAVLPGRDGKLLIDAGFAGARPQITDALAGISSEPIKHLINTHWHLTIPTATNGCTLLARPFLLTRIRGNICPPPREWRAGNSRSSPHQPGRFLQ